MTAKGRGQLPGGELEPGHEQLMLMPCLQRIQNAEEGNNRGDRLQAQGDIP